MRDVLIRDYVGLDLDEVWDVPSGAVFWPVRALAQRRFLREGLIGDHWGKSA
jgi:hypothetical protein